MMLRFCSSPITLPQVSLSSHPLTLGAHHTKCTSLERKGITFPSQRPPESVRASRNGRRMIDPVCEKMDDGFYMRRCVELARKAIGFTSPNPMVGCVIVKDGEIVGEGFHPKAGQPHAELWQVSPVTQCPLQLV